MFILFDVGSKGDKGYLIPWTMYRAMVNFFRTTYESTERLFWRILIFSAHSAFYVRLCDLSNSFLQIKLECQRDYRLRLLCNIMIYWTSLFNYIVMIFFRFSLLLLLHTAVVAFFVDFCKSYVSAIDPEVSSNRACTSSFSLDFRQQLSKTRKSLGFVTSFIKKNNKLMFTYSNKSLFWIISH